MLIAALAVIAIAVGVGFVFFSAFCLMVLWGAVVSILQLDLPTLGYWQAMIVGMFIGIVGAMFNGAHSIPSGSRK